MANVCQRGKDMAPLPKMQGLEATETTEKYDENHRLRATKTPALGSSLGAGTEARSQVFERLMR